MTTQTQTADSATPFQDLGLSPLFETKLNKQGFTSPTAIQAKAIPVVLEAKDLVATAPTGSGKSAAFLLPMLQKVWIGDDAGKVVLDPGAPRALTLVPTRELASQLAFMARSLQPPKSTPPLEITGGMAYPPQFRALERPQPIIFATPGRLRDLMNDGRVSLNNLELLVLDEADRMLEMGFTDDLDAFLSAAPDACQKILFSATMPRWVQKAADKFLHEPERVVVEQTVDTMPSIEQGVWFTPRDKKQGVLKTLLEDEKLSKVLVFVNTKAQADRLEADLRKSDIRTAALHGDHSQGQRRRTLAMFRSDEIRVLVASDVAARGVDLPDVSHVINYDLPVEFDTYVHRIGRTGRAKQEGVAINLADRNEVSFIRLVQKRYELELMVLADDLPAKVKGKRDKGAKPTWNNRRDSAPRRLDQARENQAENTGFEPADGSFDEQSDRRDRNRPARGHSSRSNAGSGRPGYKGQGGAGGRDSGPKRSNPSRPDFAERSDRGYRGDRDRSDDRSGGRSEGRSEGGYRGRSDDRSGGRSEGRSEGGYRGRSDDRSGGRSEGRSGGRSEGGYRGRSDDRSGGRSEGRSEGGYRGRSDDRAGGRPEGRYRGRSDDRSGGRSEGRSEGGYRGRSDDRSGGRSEGRSEGRYRGRSDDRSGGRSEGGYRGRSDDRAGGRPEGRSGGRSEGRPADRSKDTKRPAAGSSRKNTDQGPVRPKRSERPKSYIDAALDRSFGREGEDG